MTLAYLSLGANQGEPVQQLIQALRLLAEEPGVHLAAVSPVYKTAPQGKTDQPDFYNCAVAVDTALTPQALLAVIQRVEQRLGRERKERWGPRTIDIDILHFGQEMIEEEGLTIPHPRMWERQFVLRPLLDVVLSLGVEPLTNLVQAALSALPDQGVELYLDGGSFHHTVKGVE